MKKYLLGAVLSLGILISPAFTHAADIVIQEAVFGSPLVIKASPEVFGGAIYSLRWRGFQFINSTDHGRELQSASSFDGFGECYNPTEAGSKADGDKPTSSSQVLSVSSTANSLHTRAKMAFWLLPGEDYEKTCGSRTGITTAQNTTVTSEHILEKNVTIGFNGMKNVIEYQITFHIPENRTSATFEALTGYMPAQFSRFLTYNPANGQASALKFLSYGPGEQSYPVILSNESGTRAMGVYAPDHLPTNPIGYGRFQFPNISGSDPNKWNCVFRKKDIVPGAYQYSCFVVIGNVNQVIKGIHSLQAYFHPELAAAEIPKYTFNPGLYRFYKNYDHFLTKSYGEGESNNYKYEGIAFRYHASQLDSAMHMLYRCRIPSATSKHFVSMEANCEGQSYEGKYGYVSSQPRIGYQDIYRFSDVASADHLTTTNYQEGVDLGYAYEGILGYAPIAPFESKTNP
ncbi:MAG: hypothetical protein L0H94_11945 [Nitrospira sp.]|nr:hypothetical protein [Nitrospira sp.]